MLELEHRFRVVDVHARLDPPEEEDVARRGRAITPERLEREMHQAGVVRSVVFAGPRTDGAAAAEGYLSANNAVARLSVERPFVALARINGPRDPGSSPASGLRNLVSSRGDHHTAPEEVEQYAYDDRFHGFRLDPARDGLPDDEVLAELDEVGLPVLVTGGQSFPPAAIAEHLLGRSFPVVVAHFGGHPLDRDLMAEMIDRLGDYEDCYVDTSFVHYRDPLETALLEHPDRVLFGSGAPSTHPNVGVMEVLTLDVSEDKMRAAFSKNPGRVFPVLDADWE